MLLYEVIEETISIKLPFLILVTVSLINLNIFSLAYGQQQTSSPNSNIPNEGAPKPIVHVIIEGTENADKIKGGDGNDKLDDGKGNDELDGGEGKDKLKGGKVADTFICDLSDKISDFDSSGGDKK